MQGIAKKFIISCCPACWSINWETVQTNGAIWISETPFAETACRILMAMSRENRHAALRLQSSVDSMTERKLSPHWSRWVSLWMRSTSSLRFYRRTAQPSTTTTTGGGGTPAFYTDNCLGIEEQPQFTLAAELPWSNKRPKKISQGHLVHKWLSYIRVKQILSTVGRFHMTIADLGLTVNPI